MSAEENSSLWTLLIENMKSKVDKDNSDVVDDEEMGEFALAALEVLGYKEKLDAAVLTATLKSELSDEDTSSSNNSDSGQGYLDINYVMGDV